MILLFLAATVSAPLRNTKCPGGTETEIVECAQIDTQQADAELSRQWPLTVQAMREIDARASTGTGGRFYRPNAYLNLVRAQRAWLVFRSAGCSSEADKAAGGVDGPVVEAQCRERRTRERTLELKDLAMQP